MTLSHHMTWSHLILIAAAAFSGFGDAHALQASAPDLADPFQANVVQPGWPRLDTSHLPPVSPTFGFTAAPAIDCTTALPELAPSLVDECQMEMTSWRPSRGGRHHEVCQLTCHDLKVHRAQVVLHFVRNQLSGVSGALPPSAPEQVRIDDLPQPEEFSWSGPITSAPELIFTRDGDQLVPAWRLIIGDALPTEEIRAAYDGALLHAVPLHFAAFANTAQVFPENPVSTPLTAVTLPALDGSGFLSGSRGYVEATDVPRVHRPEGDYMIDPGVATDGAYFDQIQAYFHFEQAFSWFQARFGTANPATAIRVRTNDVIKGSGDNAIFDPPTNSIHIGRGGSLLHSLARDADVLTHELSHYIIFQTIKARYGESVVLHEGYADYFAYARQGNPQLAETIRYDGLPLRTAKLPPGTRYDDPIGLVGPHNRGQLWSAVLWDVREMAGPVWDTVAYDSLAHFAPEATVAEAFKAILAADQAAVDSATAELPYTSQRCNLLAVGVKWGFAPQLASVEAPECGLDLPALVEESRRYAAARRGEPVLDGPSRSFTFMGRTCSMIPGAPVANPLTMRWLWLLFMALPMFLRLRR